MKVSVIVPTYNGAHKLPAIIKALKDQTWPPCEVLVAVDGSTDDTVQVLQQLKPSLPSLKIIEQENKWEAMNISKTANRRPHKSPLLRSCYLLVR